MAHEQMPPVCALEPQVRGGRAAAAGAAPATPCSGRPGASLWRLLAANDGHAGRVPGPDGVPAGSPTRVTLTPGEVLEVDRGRRFRGDVVEPLLMTQGIDCEPSLSLAISADKLLDGRDVRGVARRSIRWSRSPYAWAERAPSARRRCPSTTTLFAPAGGGYEVARVPLPPCPASEQVCAHRLQGSFGMTLRGMDVLASYALTAPAWDGCIDPTRLRD